jgi:hypothetical protein
VPCRSPRLPSVVLAPVVIVVAFVVLLAPSAHGRSASPGRAKLVAADRAHPDPAESVTVRSGGSVGARLRASTPGLLWLRARATGCDARLQVSVDGRRRATLVVSGPGLRWYTISGRLAAGGHRVRLRAAHRRSRCHAVVASMGVAGAAPDGLAASAAAAASTAGRRTGPVRRSGGAALGTFNAGSAGDLRAWGAAGGTTVVVGVVWERAQPSRGGPIDLSHAGMQGQDVREQIDEARRLGLGVILEPAIQYPPQWAKDAIPAFRDQAGTPFTSAIPGADVRDWVWTQAGRRLVSGFVRGSLEALRSRFNAIDGVRMGGGTFGEAQYPRDDRSIDGSPAFWAYGSAAQSGVGLADGERATPLPGYVYGDGTPRQDRVWAQWYLGSLASWIHWYALELRNGGWSGPVYVEHPSFGVRDGWQPRSRPYEVELAHGTDFGVQMDAYASLPNVWPWSTWADDTDRSNASPSLPDADKAAWRKLLEEARARGLDAHIMGENTGGGGRDAVRRLANALHAGYAGVFVLDFPALVAGGDPMLSSIAPMLNLPRR